MRMHFRFIPAIMIALCFIQCKKDNNGETDNGTTSGTNSIASVPEEQKALLIAYLGTWSGACAPAAVMLDSVSKDHLVHLNLHVGPSNLAPYFRNLGGFYERAPFSLDAITGLEQFPVPAVSINGNETEVAGKESYETAAATFAQTKPMANTVCKIFSGADNGQLVIDTRTQFFKADNSGDEYVLSLFIVEDDIEQTQSGSWEGFKNNHIIRAAIGGTLSNPMLFHSIVAGSIGEGTAINRTFTFTYENPGNPAPMNHWIWNPAKTSIAVVLSKRDGNMNYTFVNASMIPVMP
jgi:hypothetical protein